MFSHEPPNQGRLPGRQPISIDESPVRLVERQRLGLGDGRVRGSVPRQESKLGIPRHFDEGRTVRETVGLFEAIEQRPQLGLPPRGGQQPSEHFRVPGADLDLYDLDSELPVTLALSTLCLAQLLETRQPTRARTSTASGHDPPRRRSSCSWHRGPSLAFMLTVNIIQAGVLPSGAAAIRRGHRACG